MLAVRSFAETTILTLLLVTCSNNMALAGDVDQSCEADFAAAFNAAVAGCKATYDCSGGAQFSSSNPRFYNSEMFLGMLCVSQMCDGSGEWSDMSYHNFQKCPSMIGLQAKKIIENVYRPTNRCGSIIQAENKILGESVPVTGTNFQMNYFTSWVPGRTADYGVGADFTKGLISWTSYVVPVTYDINIYVGGSSGAAYSSANVTTPQVAYVWNGLDSLGNPVLGSTSVKSVITAQTLSGPIDIEDNLNIGSLKAIYLGLGGWLPDNFYYYDQNSKTLYKGDGSTEKLTAKSWGSSGFYLPVDDTSRILYFDSTGRIVEVKTGLLGTTIQTFTYDSSGRLASIVEPFAKTTYFNRDSNGKFISITAPNGKITTVTVGADGYLSSITNPLNQTYSFTYYGTDGLLASFTKPGAQVSTFTYDQYGNLSADTHSGGFFWSLYKDINKTDDVNTIMETPMGRKTSYSGSYNSLGSGNIVINKPTGGQDLNSVASDGGGETRTSGITLGVGRAVDQRFPDFRYTNSRYYRDDTRNYVATGDTVSVSTNDPNDPFSISSYKIDHYRVPNYNAVTEYTPSTKTFNTTTGLGYTSSATIDAYERVISESSGNLTQTNYSYTLDKLTSVTQGSRVSSFGYNSATGYLESVTNPLNQTTLFGYNDAGELIGQVGPDLRSVTYQRDSNGNISGITPFGRPMHSFTINGNELPAGYQPPSLTGVSNVNTTYSYNLDKQLTQITKPTGQTIAYSYDGGTGQLTQISTPNGDYTIVMTADDNVASIILPSGLKNQFEYAGHEVVETKYRNSADTLIYRYRKEYESNGLSLSDLVENPSGTRSSISYSYNAGNQLSTAGDMTLTYNTPNGQLTTVKMGTSSTTGFTDTYTYNTFGEVTGYTVKRGSTTIYTMNLTRDALGRIDTKTQTMNSATDAYVYGFDVAGRLQQVTKNSSVVANYGYDSNSNRNSGNVGAQTTTATYDDQDRLTAYNSLTFTYNANGDLQSKTNTVTNTTTQYTYDVFGNLTQVILPGGTTTITYEIDGLDRRVAQKINGVIQKRWVYQDQYRIAAEMNSSGTITKRFVYGSKGNIPDYMIASGVKYRIISDQLGSTRLVVKQSDGTISQRMNHDEFGRVTEDTNPGFVPFGFAGGLYDSQTSLVRFGARDYDPEIGRWTAKDPIGFEGDGENLYQYVKSEPVNFIDMRGTSTYWYGAEFGAAIGAAIAGPVGAVTGAVIGTAAVAYTTYVVSQKLSKWQWTNLHDNTGRHPEQIKEDYLGKGKGAEWDLYIEKDGKIVVRPKDKKNKSVVETDYGKDDLKSRGKCEKKNR